jgi:general secretion pathway protein B
MSLILDALKKLDREKSSRRARTGNIAVEILRPERTFSGKRIRLYVAAVFLAAIAAAAITYGMMEGFGFSSKSSPPARVNPPPSSQEVAPPAPSREPIREAQDEIRRVDPKIPSSAERGAESKNPAISASPPSPGPVSAKPSRPEVAPPPSSNEPVHEARGESGQIPPKVVSSPASKAESKDLAAVPSEKKASQKVIPEEASVAPGNVIKAPESTPKESASNPPVLSLSGILWHEEPSERRAMINGITMKEGSVIEGVKVVEIHPTRVRLSYNGRPFEISINILDK